MPHDPIDTIFISLYTFVTAVLLDITNMYASAIVIAFVASLFRIAYDAAPVPGCENDGLCVRFWKFYALCLPEIEGMVHLGIVWALGTHEVILLSSIIAATARETVSVVFLLYEKALKRFLLKILGKY
jgi:hypothetical protein